MKKNKNKIIIITIIILILIIGTTYAAWILFFSQNNKNRLASTCFNIILTDENPINLEKAYPLTDEQGKRLEPYTFTLTNKCNSSTTYEINLEILNNSTITDMNYIKVQLDDATPVVVSKYGITEKSLDDAKTAYKINSGYLTNNETRKFSLRIWIDESVTMDTPNIQGNFLEAKVTAKAVFIPDDAVPATAKITELAKSDTTNLAVDDYGNIRYIGSNPNNFVKVDGEYWRIIGVMKNVDNGVGQIEDRVKLIRAESIGQYSWDTSDSSVNSGLGVNEWSEADLMKLLNPGYESESIGGSLYYNQSTGTCYNGQKNATISCDFTSMGLGSELKGFISNTLWNTGAIVVDNDNDTTTKFYQAERETLVGKNCTSGEYCNDNVVRTTSWIGQVGLMYVSDYGYATSGGSTLDRNSCLSLSLHKWDSSINTNANDCYENDWLKAVTSWNTTLSIVSNNKRAHSSVGLLVAGMAGTGSTVGDSGQVKPVVYLSSNVQIVSGDGTRENAYLLG